MAHNLGQQVIGVAARLSEGASSAEPVNKREASHRLGFINSNSRMGHEPECSKGES